jgi:hypothetical protein
LNLKFFRVGNLALVLTLLLPATVFLAGCGDYATYTPEQMTLQARPSIEAPRNPPTATAASTAGATKAATKAPTVGAASPQPATGTRTATVAASATDLPSLTDKYPEKTVIRNFSDSQGRKVKLVYGRGSGHNGDYGWAHIYGKHFKGIWYDGGTISTFPQDAGAKTPQDVVDLIQKSLTDQKPDSEANDRLSYSYPIPGRNKDVFTVVGNDGTIITSYPVNHGSKDADN